MEVVAAMLTYQDEQLGRVIDEMERMGELDRTFVALILGDNGASADAGPEGTLNEVGMANGLEEGDDWRTANIDLLGGPHTYANYPAAWAWAMNTPLRWNKQYASMLGGIRNGMILAWPGQVTEPNSVCAQFGHVVDIAPTFLEAAELPAPQSVFGVEQKALDGESLLTSLNQCEPDTPRLQYFEITGKLGLFHNGWFASKDDGRRSWERVNPRDEDDASWELYDLRSDFSQAHNVAGQHPEILENMVALWRSEAERNNVFPLDDRFGSGRLPADWTPGEGADRRQFVYWGKDISVPSRIAPHFIGRSFTIEAEIELEKAEASGVIMALGSWFGGWSLFLEEGKPAFAYARSTRPEETVRVVSTRALSEGKSNVMLTFRSVGVDKPATFELSVDKNVLVRGETPDTFRVPAGLGETLDVGRDLGVPVTQYHTPHGRIEGDIRKVTVSFE